MGQFYCIACARHFVDKDTLLKHNATKPHKKRVKDLNKEVPYGVNLVEVYGMKIDNGKKD